MKATGANVPKQEANFAPSQSVASWGPSHRFIIINIIRFATRNLSFTMCVCIWYFLGGKWLSFPSAVVAHFCYRMLTMTRRKIFSFNLSLASLARKAALSAAKGNFPPISHPSQTRPGGPDIRDLCRFACRRSRVSWRWRETESECQRKFAVTWRHAAKKSM